MFDSAVKYPHGILYGSLYQLGNFDECISVIEPEKEFRGQYCLADVTIKSNNHTKLTEVELQQIAIAQVTIFNDF